MLRSLMFVVVCGVAVVIGTQQFGYVHAGDKESGDISLSEATWKQVQEKVAAHKGKVVVLDAWATSCPACVEEFPGLVALQKKHGDNVVCMSISCDYQGIKTKPPKFYREKVLKFLTKQDASFENLLATQPADEMYSAMGVAAIPVVFVYGKDGKLVKRFDNESIEKEEDAFTYKKDINKLVDGLVKK